MKRSPAVVPACSRANMAVYADVLTAGCRREFYLRYGPMSHFYVRPQDRRSRTMAYKRSFADDGYDSHGMNGKRYRLWYIYETYEEAVEGDKGDSLRS